jgi:hypothetical protein
MGTIPNDPHGHPRADRMPTEEQTRNLLVILDVIRSAADQAGLFTAAQWWPSAWAAIGTLRRALSDFEEIMEGLGLPRPLCLACGAPVLDPPPVNDRGDFGGPLLCGKPECAAWYAADRADAVSSVLD